MCILCSNSQQDIEKTRTGCFYNILDLKHPSKSATRFRNHVRESDSFLEHDFSSHAAFLTHLRAKIS